MNPSTKAAIYWRHYVEQAQLMLCQRLTAADSSERLEIIYQIEQLNLVRSSIYFMTPSGIQKVPTRIKDQATQQLLQRLAHQAMSGDEQAAAAWQYISQAQPVPAGRKSNQNVGLAIMDQEVSVHA